MEPYRYLSVFLHFQKRNKERYAPIEGLGLCYSVCRSRRWAKNALENVWTVTRPDCCMGPARAHAGTVPVIYRHRGDTVCVPPDLKYLAYLPYTILRKIISWLRIQVGPGSDRVGQKFVWWIRTVDPAPRVYVYVFMYIYELYVYVFYICNRLHKPYESFLRTRKLFVNC
jgi:hypothetical protein